MLYQHFLLQADWKDSAVNMMQSTASTMIMLHLLQRYTNIHWQQIPQIRSGLSPYALKQVKDYINQNLDQNITLSEMSAIVNLSEYHFARMFKISVGLAPHQYLMQSRLQYAAKLLHEKTLSIIEIAIKAGFNSASYFSQQFKNYYSVTPSVYRSSL